MFQQDSKLLGVSERVPRLSDSETREVVSKIPSIRGMFLSLETGEARSLGLQVDDEGSKGFLYQTRFHKLKYEHPHKKGGKTAHGQGNGGKDEKKKEAGGGIHGLIQGSLDEDSTYKADQSHSSSSYDDKTKSGGGSFHTVDKASTLAYKRKFAISLATLASKKDKRPLVIRDGGVKTLMSLSLILDDQISVSCSLAFSLLAKEKQFRSKIIEDGGLSNIVNLTTANIPLVISNCCVAICNLCCEAGFEHRAVKEGVVHMISTIIHANPACKETCLRILHNLCCVADKYNRLEDVMDILIHFNNGSDYPDLNLIEETLVLKALVNCSAIRTNQLKLVEDGCMRVVSKALVSANVEIRNLAGDIVRNLSFDHKARAKLLEQNIINIVLKMTKDDERIKTSGMKALYCLSKDNSCRYKMIHNSNAVTHILDICRDKITNVDNGRLVARTLRIFCGDFSATDQLIRDGVTKALASLLKTEDAVILQYCVESICAFFQIGHAVIMELIRKGLPSMLVGMAQSSSNNITSEWCSFALYMISKEVLDKDVIEKGILPSLLKICVTSTPRGKCFCSAAFVLLSNIPEVDSSSIIPILAHMLKNESDKTTKTNCATALYNLAHEDANCKAMLDNGALLPIVALSKSEFVQTKMKCAAILSRLSLHEQYYHLFASDSVLKVLLDLSMVDDLKTQRRVITALSNLSQKEELRFKILSLNPLRYIIPLCSKRDEFIWLGCTTILCNLSSDFGSEAMLISAGIMPSLIVTAMINTAIHTTKVIALKTITNLMADESLYKPMIADGIIWAISSLGQLETDNPEILKLCADAMCRLSCNFSREMLHTPVAIKTVIKLINQDNLDLIRTGARTLTNMLLSSTDADHNFRKHVVARMTMLGLCKDNEVSELTIFCLCLASQSESCRSGIVSSGLLRTIDASDIFSVPSVCYAYLTMFGNIANNPEMRTMLLDDNSIARFQQIVNTHDPNLDLAVSKAIYYITCSPENIEKLVRQNIIPIIDTIWEAPYPKSFELMHHVIAILYNLCVFPTVHNQLVVQGIVPVFGRIWQFAKDQANLCRLIQSSVTHLAAFGNVNTTKIIDEECLPLIVFITSCRLSRQFSNLVFEPDTYIRSVVAFRNLVNCVSNQERLVANGLLLSLLEIYKMAPRFPATKGQIVRKSITGTLKMLTFNSELHNVLIESGALKIILEIMQEEMQEEGQNVNVNLLKEIEAESWINGSRGVQREAKPAIVAPAPLYVELLRSTMNVKLDVEVRRVYLSKFDVRVERGGDLDGNSINVANDDESQPLLGISVKDLASFEGDDETSFAIPCQWPKQEMQISNSALEESMAVIKHKRVQEAFSDVHENSLDMSDQDFEPAISLPPPVVLTKDDKSLSKSASSTPKGGSPKSKSGRLEGEFPRIGSGGPLGSLSSNLANNVPKAARRPVSAASVAKKIDSLVNLIRSSKDVAGNGNGPSINDVMSEWYMVSGQHQAANASRLSQSAGSSSRKMLASLNKNVNLGGSNNVSNDKENAGAASSLLNKVALNSTTDFSNSMTNNKSRPVSSLGKK